MFYKEKCNKSIRKYELRMLLDRLLVYFHSHNPNKGNNELKRVINCKNYTFVHVL